jgi:hypothetical protein
MWNPNRFDTTCSQNFPPCLAVAQPLKISPLDLPPPCPTPNVNPSNTSLKKQTSSSGNRISTSVENTIVCLIFVLATLFISHSGGNLFEGPRFIDENQIFVLDRAIKQDGFASTATAHIEDRVLRMKRLVPVYLLHKLTQVWVFGANLLLWSIYTASLSGITAFLFFWIARRLHCTLPEAFFLGAIVCIGEQSVLSWRLLHGEGIGLLMLAISWLSLTLSKPGQRNGLSQGAFVTFAVLASLSKESFIMFIPASIAYLVWHEKNMSKLKWQDCIKKNIPSISTLIIVFAIEMTLILFILKRTYFHYSGWNGFDIGRLVAVIVQFFHPSRAWVVIAAIWAVAVASRFFRQNKDDCRIEKTDLAIFGLLLGLIFGPQFILYMSSGMSGGGSVDFERYLVPSTIGLGILCLAPVVVARRLLSKAPRDTKRSERRLRVGTILLFSCYLVQQTALAVKESKKYGAYTQHVTQLMKVVSEHTSPESNIVVVIVEGRGYFVRRLIPVFAEYLDRENLYFMPLKMISHRRQPSFKFYWAEVNVDTLRAKSRLIKSLDDMPEHDAVLVLRASGKALSKLQVHEPRLFNPDKYHQYSNEIQDFAFFPVRQ